MNEFIMDSDIYDKDLLYDFLIDSFYRWIAHCRRDPAADPRQLPPEQVYALGRKTELMSRILCEKALHAFRLGDAALADRLLTDAAAMLPADSGFADALMYCAVLKRALGVPQADEYRKAAKARDPRINSRMSAIVSPFAPALKDPQAITAWASAD